MRPELAVALGCMGFLQVFVMQEVVSKMVSEKSRLMAV
jgi:hypothetical protein